jgi:hypothetical protein
MLRLAIFHPNVAQKVIDQSGDSNSHVLKRLLKILQESHTQELNVIQVLQILCNGLIRRASTVFLIKNGEEILGACAFLVRSANKKVKQIISCLLINFAIAFYHRSKNSKDLVSTTNMKETKLQCLSTVIELLKAEEVASSLYRLIVVIGTLIYKDEEAKSVASVLELESMIADIQMNQIYGSESNLLKACSEVKTSLNGSA